MDKNTMSFPVNIKNIPAHHLCCGNVILYLDQLWKVTRIEHASNDPYISFHAERQPRQPIASASEQIHQDILHLTRIPETEITIVESVA